MNRQTPKNNEDKTGNNTCVYFSGPLNIFKIDNTTIPALLFMVPFHKDYDAWPTGDVTKITLDFYISIINSETQNKSTRKLDLTINTVNQFILSNAYPS